MTKTAVAAGAASEFGIWIFGHLNLFRASIFGFRIYPPKVDLSLLITFNKQRSRTKK